jgi:phage protein D
MSKYIEVNFPNADVKPTLIQSVSFHQERNKHEFATLEFREGLVDFSNIRPGTPVNFKLKNVVDSKDFYGYVHHIEPDIAPGKTWTKIHLIGASYVLNQPKQKVWINKTGDQIASTIAKAYNFAYDVVAHPRVFPMINQAGMSDYQFLLHIGKKIGHTLNLSNATLSFKEGTTNFDLNKNNAPVFTMRPTHALEGSSLYSFTPLIGEALDQNGEIKSATAISGVDRNTVKPIQVTNQKRLSSKRQIFQPEHFDGFDTKTVASDLSVAKSEAEAFDHRTRYPYHARVEVIGSPNLAPNQPIYLQGVGSTYTGHWIILSVEHKIESVSYNLHQYTTILNVATDSLGSTVDGSGVPPMQQSPSNTLKRNIVPGVRQTAVKPITKISVGRQLPTKNQVTGFGTVTNRSTPTVAHISVIPNTWKSPSGPLNTYVKEVRQPSFVQERVARRRNAG